MTWPTVETEEAAPGRATSPEEAPDLEVVVLGATSPLDTGSLFGRGHGVLASDRSVALTFLLGREDFVALRQRVLSGVKDLSLSVRVADVTAVDLGGGVSPRIRPLS